MHAVTPQCNTADTDAPNVRFLIVTEGVVVPPSVSCIRFTLSSFRVLLSENDVLRSGLEDWESRAGWVYCCMRSALMVACEEVEGLKDRRQGGPQGMHWGLSGLAVG